MFTVSAPICMMGEVRGRGGQRTNSKERNDTMRFRVTNREQSRRLVDQLCADVAQGRVGRTVVRKVYIQRAAFSDRKVVALCHRLIQPCQKWFQLWFSYVKPNGNGAVVSVAALAFAALVTISLCSLNGDKRRLEAEKSQLLLENAQLNSDVDSLTDTVDEVTSINKEQDKLINDQQQQIDSIADEKDAQIEDLLEKLEDWDLLSKVTSRSMSQSAATTQIAEAKAAIVDILGNSNVEKAEQLIAKLEAEEARINWYASHYPDYYPTYGWLTSTYGWRRDPVTEAYTSFHDGIDIANNVGTPVYAAGAGTVIAAGTDSGYGLCIVIDHGNGYKTRYAHLSKMLVSVGDQVSKADRIGLMGATGRVTGSHLHFELFLNGETKNPLNYVG